MCGIYGELALCDGERVGEHGEAAIDLLAHRGPDDRGSWRDDGIFLGVRRLSIIDPEHGAQPMRDRRGRLCIAYNGELYNFRELRNELAAAGHRFATASDTEVVLNAYERWGPECVTRFNGMFAFAIWDAAERVLFLARDRIGEKPLYYREDGRRLAFASEIKALLADPAVPRRINPRGLANYLAFGHSLAGQTIYDGVSKLPPAHVLLVKHGRVTIDCYWDVEREPERITDSPDAVISLLDDAVNRRLVADVPVGAMLSGGLDSSSVVALMRRHSSGPVKTFAAGFSGAPDELAGARRVASALGAEHHEVTVTPRDVPPSLTTLARHFDEPFADPAAVPLLALSRLAREHVKVVLTGDGGDELFGGYGRYVADQLAPVYQRLTGVIGQRALPALAGLVPRTRRLKRIARTLPITDPASRYASWLRVFDRELLAELVHDDVAAAADHDPDAGYRRHYAHLNGSRAGGHLNRLMYVDVKSWLADAYTEKTDKTTMACGLEARMPLLDHRLVELAFSIPPREKIRGTSTKRIFRRAVAGLVPEYVIGAKKRGFTVPLDRWLGHELSGWTRELLLDPQARGRGYFDHRVVESLLCEHIAGRRVHSDALWVLLNFELWHRACLDGEGL
jgi:asparagine synthase (glutamine-hydrolysing)